MHTHSHIDHTHTHAHTRTHIKLYTATNRDPQTDLLFHDTFRVGGVTPLLGDSLNNNNNNNNNIIITTAPMMMMMMMMIEVRGDFWGCGEGAKCLDILLYILSLAITKVAWHLGVNSRCNPTYRDVATNMSPCLFVCLCLSQSSLSRRALCEPIIT